ncbi:MAG TPA: ABC transporter permease [Stellaceae bacterium]|nr:ABC transporter permease [Stellaceae bacterium]
MDFLIRPFAIVYRHRRLLFRSVATEMRHRYAGSLVGVLWVVVAPLLLLALYALVYAVIFRIRPLDMSTADYVLRISCGLMPLLGFNEALATGTTSLSLNKQVLLNTVFPSELVPLRAVIAGSASSVAGLLMVLIGAAILHGPSFTFLAVPVVLFCQLMLVAGVAWILSLANLVLRDIQQVLSFLTIVLLVASPVAYTPAMLPASLSPFIYCNPLSYFVIAFQNVIADDVLPRPIVVTGLLVLGLLALTLGFEVFRRAKQVFFDYA